MICFPKETHKIHKFKKDNRLYIADLETLQVIEVDPVLWDIVDMCESHTNTQIVESLEKKHGEADVIEALEELETLEKLNIIFSAYPSVERELERQAPRKRIFIPHNIQVLSDLRLKSVGTEVSLQNTLKHLTQYADIYMAGETERKIEEGIYETPFHLFNRRDYYGILAWLDDREMHLFPYLRHSDVPIIIQIHAPRGHGGTELNAILAYYSALREFDAFSAPSASVRDYYSQFVWDANCFHAIPNGVDSQMFKPMEKEAAKRELAQIVQDERFCPKPVVGFFSRIQPEKGACIFVEVAEMNPDVLFVVAGRFLLRLSFRQLPDNLIYAGFQPREIIPTILNAFDVYFRTRPGTIRSVHPTHSVSGVGAKAESLLKEHYWDTTPCGEHSPFRRLREARGQILFLGCGLRPNTSMHAVEELVQPPYLLGNPIDYRIILAPGKEIKMRVRRHNFGIWAQRYDRLGPLLDENGLKKGKVLESTVDLVDCEQMWERALIALKKEPFFFVERR